jgi:hypothetical protein
MHWVVGLLAVQALSVPAYSPPGALPPPVPEQLSLVVATTVSETDPQPLCDRPNCTSLFLGRYAETRTLAGPAVDAAFAARVEMGSPWVRPYRLALIVEHRPGQEPLVRAMTGFSRSTGQACFGVEMVDIIGWRPQAAGVSLADGDVCVTDPG